MKKIITLGIVCLLMINIVSANQINEQTFADMTRQELRQNLNPTIDDVFNSEGLKVISLYVNKVVEHNGNYYIMKQQIHLGLKISDIRECLDNYSNQICYNNLVSNTNTFEFQGRTIKPIMYQYNKKINEHLDNMQDLQDKINNQEDNSGFDWWGLFN